ncbi:MAG: D-tyrosyl-tRNA(Tyr) deacylase [Candidatus Omnitrophica bacterium]|nr:D-tyrosyl-tRNA(Tyr) deacylase [Candidatus Omnitrophota bacterium]
MRAVIQRVTSASVTVKNKLIAKIAKGLVIFLGVEKQDASAQARILAQRIQELRIFGDAQGKMNLSAQDIQAELLVVSQFTLCADTAKSGRRPSFDRALEPALAEKLYLEFIQNLKKSQLKVAQGVFKEYMSVHLDNDGPVTFILEAKQGNA